MITFERKNLTDETLIEFFKKLLLPRMIEEKMLVLLRQGRISKWFSGIGQEAVAVGAALALENDEWIMPLHRNLGVFTTRGMTLGKLFLQWQGSKNGFSKGRERSFHFGSAEHHICGMISHLGPQLTIANGTSLAHKLRNEKKVSLAFTGEGGTSEGDFHEALNVASVWDLPVIFIIENNGYGLSTPINEQFRCEQLVDRAKGYGMEAVRIDGNNLITVYDTIKGVREYCIKNQRPYLIECMTFRMRGHEEASGIKYVPAHLFEEWAQKDPVTNFEHFLVDEEVLSQEGINEIRESIRQYIDRELKAGFAESPLTPDTATELGDVYAISAPEIKTAAENESEYADAVNAESGTDVVIENIQPSEEAIEAETATGEAAAELVEAELVQLVAEPVEATRDEAMPIRLIDAVKEALDQSMQKHANLILMGQDIAEYGGAFKITDGFVAKYGKERVRNTPLCESAIVGAALGLSLEGFKSMMEMQFADFVTVGFNQIINNLAKIHYRWGQKADVVVRMPTGGGVGAGPFHSQSNEAWFVHTPGLKVVYPSTPEDAKGLLIASFNDPNPVMFFEHKALYRSVSGIVPVGYYETPIGKARQVSQGTDISIITYGAGVHWATEYAVQHPEISFDIVDLRTLLPIDWDAVRISVERTGKVVVLHEDVLTGGIGGEIAAWIAEHCFTSLDAPVKRCASLDTPIPFNILLESNFMAKSRLNATVQELLTF